MMTVEEWFNDNKKICMYFIVFILIIVFVLSTGAYIRVRQVRRLYDDASIELRRTTDDYRRLEEELRRERQYNRELEEITRRERDYIDRLDEITGESITTIQGAIESIRKIRKIINEMESYSYCVNINSNSDNNYIIDNNNSEEMKENVKEDL